MGMYTELILGAELYRDTPDYVINILRYMIGEIAEKPSYFPFKEENIEYMLTKSSYYFGISESLRKIWKDNIDGKYRISVRCNCKNYNNEIDTFLSWIKPFIESGSGEREMYAIVIYEECDKPKIYYLIEEDLKEK